MPTGQSAGEVVATIKEAMLEVSIGAIALHTDLRALVPASLMERYYHYTIKARLRLNREMGIVFETVCGQGYRRLGGASGVDHAGKQPIVKIRRVSKRGIPFLIHAYKNANDMTAEQTRQACNNEMKLRMIHEITLARTVMPIPEPPEPRADPRAGLRELAAAVIAARGA
jgi:hypothetical protein